MLGKKKPPKEPDYSKMPVLPNKLAGFVQEQAGLTMDELLKLLESLGRIDESLQVSQRRKVEGKEYSKPVGRKKLIAIAEAIEHLKERIQSRLLKDEKIKELLDDVDLSDLMVRLEVNQSIYPRRLTPTDIAHSVDTAGEKLDALDQARAVPPKIYSPREETVLDVITLIKKQEAIRVARHIANRQRAYVLGRTMEELEAEHAEWLRRIKGEPEPETEEERLARLATEEVQRIEEERIAAEEAARNFDELGSVRTLLDDAAALIRDNPDAAAAIIRQWIGSTILTESKG
jgi:sulfur carrier protein ThiS